MSEKLPVHGFVLAGGKSSRMGADKALLKFQGRPLVEIAVEKLREFCAKVSIAGNRDDLSTFAPVVREERVDCGPAAGIEAGLKASTQEWVMFVPVDVPLVPGELLQQWAGEALQKSRTSILLSNKGREPAFCILRRDSLAGVTAAIDAGVRRLDELLFSIDGVWEANLGVEEQFLNVNTPEDLVKAAGEGKSKSL